MLRALEFFGRGTWILCLAICVCLHWLMCVALVVASVALLSLWLIVVTGVVCLIIAAFFPALGGLIFTFAVILSVIIACRDDAVADIWHDGIKDAATTVEETLNGPPGAIVFRALATQPLPGALYRKYPAASGVFRARSW